METEQKKQNATNAVAFPLDPALQRSKSLRWTNLPTTSSV
jgi:hypothetical protein